MKILSILKTLVDSNDSFRGQEPDEKVAMVMRWHPYVVFARVALFIIGFLMPLVLAKVFFTNLLSSNLFTTYLFMTSLWYLFIWLALFYFLTIYTLNVVVVTNKRIIYSEQKGLFNRINSELHLSRIQDISTHVEGAIETFFNFGELLIQTAGTEERFQFPLLPNPEHAKDVIMKMIEEQHLGKHTV